MVKAWLALVGVSCAALGLATQETAVRSQDTAAFDRELSKNGLTPDDRATIMVSMFNDLLKPFRGTPGKREPLKLSVAGHPVDVSVIHRLDLSRFKLADVKYPSCSITYAKSDGLGRLSLVGRVVCGPRCGGLTRYDFALKNGIWIITGTKRLTVA